LLGKQDNFVAHLISTLPARSSAATGQILSSFGAEPTADFSRCLYREECKEAAASYIIRSAATGSRTIVNYNGLAEMTADEFARVAAGFEHDQTLWHFEVSRAPP